MKKLLMFLVVLLLCSFFKSDTEVSVKANEYMDYCNIHGIKAGAFYEVRVNADSVHRVVLRNFK
jgi:hypothetical protein